MQQIIGILGSAAIVVVCLLVVWSIIRFSIISPRRLSASAPLREPDVEGVEVVCGFELPSSLAQMYREAEFVERSAFTLVDRSSTPPSRWQIDRFNPLTAVGVREWRTITGSSDVPIATDFDKGYYYVDRSGAVYHRSPSRRDPPSLVASSVENFAQFEAEHEA